MISSVISVCHYVVSPRPLPSFIHIMTLFFRKRITRKGVQILRKSWHTLANFNNKKSLKNSSEDFFKSILKFLNIFVCVSDAWNSKNLNINEKTYMGNKTQAMQEVEMFAREISPRFLWMNIIIIVMVNFQRIIMKSESIIATNMCLEYHFIIASIFFWHVLVLARVQLKFIITKK